LRFQCQHLEPGICQQLPHGDVGEMEVVMRQVVQAATLRGGHYHPPTRFAQSEQLMADTSGIGHMFQNLDAKQRIIALRGQLRVRNVSHMVNSLAGDEIQRFQVSAGGQELGTHRLFIKLPATRVEDAVAALEPWQKLLADELLDGIPPHLKFLVPVRRKQPLAPRSRGAVERGF